MIAHHRMVEGRKDLLIVILKEKINVEKLPPDLRVYLRKLTILPFISSLGVSRRTSGDLSVYINRCDFKYHC